MKRETFETKIDIQKNEEDIVINTGDKIFDHVLNSFFFYMGFACSVTAEFDLRHHLWEDTGIAIGNFLSEEFDRTKIRRFGSSIMPMDDALILVSLDVSRTFVAVDLKIEEEEKGFEIGMFREFVYGLARSLNLCIHIRQLSGINAHHIIEAAFKGMGKAFSQAFEPAVTIQSTKGTL
ncbi:MAG TPA: imidazoleglycerol-phosphate dehydratase HisB [Thermotogota bacterium]|nr:imidazoleglycerol-phosphate dehydratase HisB [Thermotogota bacterium]HPJ89814.1 imidazoleglycerol-phosphate dehydratase HisB [Thermotogota bacterium]HPR96973.1 imidazoleglycerol-phosphate dehydratase HisB [Thermotogota bacterium]